MDNSAKVSGVARHLEQTFSTTAEDLESCSETFSLKKASNRNLGACLIKSIKV